MVLVSKTEKGNRVAVRLEQVQTVTDREDKGCWLLVAGQWVGVSHTFDEVVAHLARRPVDVDGVEG